MGDVINLNDWKREHGIPLANSLYYTLKATEAQLKSAMDAAQIAMLRPMSDGQWPYAVVVGYRSMKTGDVKLLKEPRLYPSLETLEDTGVLPGHSCIGVVREK
ncbi:MAG: hypothetical protein K6C08_11225 [Oscillospiraceae bacterium]|nr:hypothetical protein [Oscillospiraceae bacterium]